MDISKDLQNVLELSFNEAKKRAHEFVTLEHLLYAMTFESKTADILKSCGADLKVLQHELYSFIEDNFPRLTHVKKIPEPKYTIGFKSLLEIAAQQAESSQQATLSSENLLVALFRQPESHAVYFLGKQNIGKFEIVKFISHGQPETPVKDTDISSFCINLNDEVKNGKIDPIIGRETELERATQVLLRRRKNNPILVGEPGVGKTAIAEGLAYNIVHRSVPKQLAKMVVYSLNIGSLMSGTKYRGEFEERMKALIDFFKDKKNSILLIDEIHLIIGAGSISQGTIDAANLLKPALAKGEIRCIGTTTFKEFRRIFEKDEALARRFERIDIHEPSLPETRLIVMGLKSKYECFHSVLFSDEAIDTILDISNTQIKHKFFPDKAIDLLDDLGSIVKIKETGKHPLITKTMIEIYKPACLKSSLPDESTETSIMTLDSQLKRIIFGQDEAISRLVDYMMISESHLNDPDRPLASFLFTGPTGVGKTALAAALAESMGMAFIRFDMSEYMEKHAVSRLIGAPPGYVGYESGGQLTESINAKPRCVLLLDEIEKAHEDIQHILLQVMDYATLTDNNGKKADFRQVVIIMTSNIGQDGFKGSLGFSDNVGDFKDKAYEARFRPEFRNRLTDTLWFNPLSKTHMSTIVEKELNVVATRLKTSRHIDLSWNETVLDELATVGFSTQYGARPLKRAIETYVLKSLSKLLLDKSKPVKSLHINSVIDTLDVDIV